MRSFNSEKSLHRHMPITNLFLSTVPTCQFKGIMLIQDVSNKGVGHEANVD